MTEHVIGTIGHRPVSLKKLEGVAWGIFFIWVGVVLLAHLSLGVSLLGIGILMLGGQVLRKGMDLNYSSFWLVVGVLFVLGGIWLLLNIQVSLIPIVSILAGIVLFVTALLHKPTPQ